MRTLPVGWADQVNQLHATSPFAWCWRLPLVRSPSLVLYAGLTNYREQLTITGAEEFYPWPIEMSAIESRGDGTLPAMTLTIGNRPRLLAQFFEDPPASDGTGMFGKSAFAHVLNVEDPSQAWDFEFTIQSASLSDESATLQLEHPNYLDVTVPQERHNPAHCRHRFGSEACGYVINAVAFFTTCNKTLSDCELRGFDMSSRRLPKLQPERFGGFLGIPRA